MREGRQSHEPALLIINPNTNRTITELIERQACNALPPGVPIRTKNVKWGTPSVETRIDAAIAAVAVLDAIVRARAAGVLIAAFSDPGLLAARELLDVPVVGIGESSLASASEAGPFAILTIQPASLPLVEELVCRNGCREQCLAIEAVPVSVLEAASPTRVSELLLKRGLQLARDRRIRSIILGGAPLGVHSKTLTVQLGLPCIDPIEAGVKRLSTLLSVSRAGYRSAIYESIMPKHFDGHLDFLERIEQALHNRPTQG